MNARNDTYRLGVKASAHYLALFNPETTPVPRGSKVARVPVGPEGDDLAFDVIIPIEARVLRADLLLKAQAVLSQVVEMDDAARATNIDGFADDESLASITIGEFFIAFEYFSSVVNSQWTEYFFLTEGAWRHFGKHLPWQVPMPRRHEERGALLALDAAYADDHASVAGVFFTHWEDAAASQAVHKRIETGAHAYEPGQFYKRELPVLMALLCESPLPVSTIIVDGYVWLDANRNRPGLGAHLHEALESRVPIIGVAKTRFEGDTWSKEVLRGESQTPLFVTSVGMPLIAAAAGIQRMHGAHRMPTLLKQADSLARQSL